MSLSDVTSNPCKNNGTCLAIGRQNCICANGWGGKFCEIRKNCTYERKNNRVYFLQKKKIFFKQDMHSKILGCDTVQLSVEIMEERTIICPKDVSAKRRVHLPKGTLCWATKKKLVLPGVDLFYFNMQSCRHSLV